MNSMPFGENTIFVLKNVNTNLKSQNPCVACLLHVFEKIQAKTTLDGGMAVGYYKIKSLGKRIDRG